MYRSWCASWGLWPMSCDRCPTPLFETGFSNAITLWRLQLQCFDGQALGLFGIPEDTALKQCMRATWWQLDPRGIDLALCNNVYSIIAWSCMLYTAAMLVPRTTWKFVALLGTIKVVIRLSSYTHESSELDWTLNCYTVGLHSNAKWTLH